MSGNSVRKLGRDVFRSAGLLNLQRIFMSDCQIQVRKSSLQSNLDIMNTKFIVYNDFCNDAMTYVFAILC